MDNNSNNQPTKERQEIEQMADELMHNSYEQLLQKYGEKNLFDKAIGQLPITSSNVVGYIQMLEHLFVLDFVPPDKINQIPKEKLTGIIKLAASLKPENTSQEVDGWLKSIDPTFSLPSNFVVADFQPGAYEIYLGLENLTSILTRNLAYEYLGDTTHFLQYNPEQLAAASDKVTNLSEKMIQEYNKAGQNPNYQVDETLFKEIIQFLATTGRTPLFIKRLTEQKNLGEAADLILKINVALQAANLIKSKYPSTKVPEDQILPGIIDYLKKSIEL